MPGARQPRRSHIAHGMRIERWRHSRPKVKLGGEVWLVEFPDDPKARPALIVSADVRNELANSVLAVPITTNLRPSPTHVPLPEGQGGLSHNSMARCENVSFL